MHEGAFFAKGTENLLKTGWTGAAEDDLLTDVAGDAVDCAVHWALNLDIREGGGSVGKLFGDLGSEYLEAGLLCVAEDQAGESAEGGELRVFTHG